MSSERTNSKNSIEELSKINEYKDESYFIDACIQAIELNEDEILNKEDCIQKINKLKINSINQKSLSNKLNKKKLDKYKNILKPITQKCIDEILEESKKEFEKISTANNNDRNDYNKRSVKNLDKNISDNFGNRINKDNNSNQNNIIHEDRNEKKLTQFFRGKQRRYTVLKHINEYLESNDVTMNELIENNPFQDKPYHIPGSYEFIEAVKFGNSNYVNDALINDGIFLFVIDYYGQTGYHWAAKLGNIKILDLLIKFGRHHNQKDFKGRTPLYLAAVNNNMEVCKYLLSNGANPFLTDKRGKTPADIAGSKKLSDFLRDSMAQPFSNPVYKAKMQKILHDRANHLFKEEQRVQREKAGRRFSIKRMVVDETPNREEKNNK
jgi:ankyrin repeat protein